MGMPVQHPCELAWRPPGCPGHRAEKSGCSPRAMPLGASRFIKRQKPMLSRALVAKQTVERHSHYFMRSFPGWKLESPTCPALYNSIRDLHLPRAKKLDYESPSFFEGRPCSICLSKLRSVTSYLISRFFRSRGRSRRISAMPSPGSASSTGGGRTHSIPNVRVISAAEVAGSACLRGAALCSSVKYFFRFRKPYHLW